MSELVSASTLAAWLGVTDKTVREPGRRGIIVRAGRGYALADSVRRYCSHHDVVEIDARLREALTEIVTEQ